MSDRGRNLVEVVQATLSCRLQKIALRSTSSVSIKCCADDPDHMKMNLGAVMIFQEGLVR